MGQTLTHGVYLPDEGERNCYSGLASNWSILDNSVGTIAEHTTALAGKAPAVHTHTKSDITDFPAYGTTAGTICEGNDSRLSDARTPVAHTHGKADITDLFNSANAWTGNQTYSGVLTLSSSSDVAEQFKQKLPKDVSTSNDAMARVNALVDLAGHYVVIETLGHWTNYVAKNTTLKYKNDSTKQGAIEFRLYSDGSGIFYAQAPFKCDLGNSYNKWQTLNGVNPGALSLPSSDSADYIDLSSNLSANAEYQYTAPYDGWLCLYVSVNEFYTENAIGLYRSDTSANSHQWAKSVTAALNLYKQAKYQGSVMLPVESGKKYICYLSLNANTTVHGKYLFMYKNKGNV